MSWTEDQIISAHEHRFENVREIQSSSRCVCYFCAANGLANAHFAPTAIVEWLNPAGYRGEPSIEVFASGPEPLSDRATAFCPNCTFDMVIGDASGLPIDDPSFVAAINNRF